MHEIIQLDLGDSLWKSNGHSTLTVGIWSPYAYQDLTETGRFYFLIVSDRASFSERIFQDEPEKVKIELIEHLRNNYPHSYVIREKMDSEDDSQRKHLGDFRTMKPFLKTFRELDSRELNEFVNEFIVLTECKHQSERADFLVNVLDGDSELHYELASKLTEIHRRSEAAETRIKELIHKLRQNTLHDMASELLEQLNDTDNQQGDNGTQFDFEQIAERDYNDPADYPVKETPEYPNYGTKSFGNRIGSEFFGNSPDEDDYTEPLDPLYR